MSMFKRLAVLGCLALWAAFVLAAPAGAGRLPADSLAYQGAFRLPEEFMWGARGITYHPAGNGGAGSLLVIGFDQNRAEFGEVSIPTPQVASDWQTLPTAQLVGAMRDFGSEVVAAVDPDTALASGIQYVPAAGGQGSDKLYGSLDQWYGVVDETHATVWFAELDGANPRGAWHVGEPSEVFHGNKSGDYLFSVPQWYAEKYLGGRTLVTGKTRGAFSGSQGPTLLAFAPWDSEDPSGNLDAVAMLWYRIDFPGCAGPNVGDKAACDYPDFTMCDKWEGGAFLASGDNQAIVLFGLKGLGENFYGEAPEGACEPSKGYHCNPYERQVIFYDVEELGQAAQGLRDPWTVVPYAIWRPDELYVSDGEGNSCGQTGGLAVDEAGGRLFLVEKGLGGHQNENSAVVHVWSVR